MRIKKDDIVTIIAGKDKGKEGKILRILTAKERVVVEGANMRTRHFKKTKERPGQKLEFEASIHVSNVMLIDPKTKKRTRIGYLKDKSGKKNRIAKRSGETLDQKPTKKTIKKSK